MNVLSGRNSTSFATRSDAQGRQPPQSSRHRCRLEPHIWSYHRQAYSLPASIAFSKRFLQRPELLASSAGILQLRFNMASESPDRRNNLSNSSMTIPSDSENYSANNELSPSPPSSSSSPLILYSPPTIWGLLRGAAINLLLPFVNGLMLGFGELLAHEAAFRLGWSGTKVSLSFLDRLPSTSVSAHSSSCVTLNNVSSPCGIRLQWPQKCNHWLTLYHR